MFVMTCLLEHRPLNLPVLILHTMATALRHSTTCLHYGRLMTRLLRAPRAYPGTKAAMIIPRDYGLYTMDILPHRDSLFTRTAISMLGKTALHLHRDHGPRVHDHTKTLARVARSVVRPSLLRT
ncbi:hypothetical protein P3X46_032430 [Hevea brasiliensis]|uniref:Secreted protein n=1 Tax=Hevea brasiliensis TaxID=3981 RepID=A0ABQ9KDD2_HEVBR|nr:hypothetical protein P3X46_032430 [Hevea brasiliensis]